MIDCIFCKIVTKETPADIVFEDEDLIVFRDANPKAKTHLLLVSKKHIPSIHHLEEGDRALVAQMIFTAKRIAGEQGFGEKGYKLNFNVGRGGGQEVDHLHLHLMSDF